MTMHRRYLVCGFLGTVLLMPPGLVSAQQRGPSGIGVVTALQGQATVARQALPDGAPLRFKDDVFFRDQVATKERSTVRLLLGGKGVVTVREQSQVTLDETVAPDGARRSILSVLAGKIAATIAHSLMRPGDEVEIRTPDAVAAIRGTVLIAEYIPPTKSAGAAKPVLLASSAPGPFLAQAGGSTGGQSNFYVITGNVTITPMGQPPVSLGPLQAMSVTATQGGVQGGAVQNMTPAQLNQVVQGLDAGRSLGGEVGGLAEAQGMMASILAQALVTSTGGGGFPTPPPVSCNPCTPIPPPPVINSTDNVLPPGLLLSLNNTAIAMSGTPVAEFTSGPANAIVPLDISGAPGTVYDLNNFNIATSPLLPVTGNSITHTGPLISLNNAALILGFDASAAFGGATDLASVLGNGANNIDPTTVTGTIVPVVRVAGTSVTNTGGALVTMTNSSGLFTLGSLLSLEGGSFTATGPGLDATDSAVFVGGPVFALRGGSRINWSGGGPLIRLVNSTLFAGGGFGDSDGTGNVVTISGAPGDTAVMLDATDSQIFFG
ncbi:MAG TPA: FecR domain-containing protein, partial [Candidatus Acidoferrum sp.]|nr:FecR domain-containing protein [Candidatus Acidoferrum sp.]